MAATGDTKCWYYRQEGTHAWRSKKGGRVCKGCGCMQNGYYGEYFVSDVWGDKPPFIEYNHFFPTGPVKYFPKDFI